MTSGQKAAWFGCDNQFTMYICVKISFNFSSHTHKNIHRHTGTHTFFFFNLKMKTSKQTNQAWDMSQFLDCSPCKHKTWACITNIVTKSWEHHCTSVIPMLGRREHLLTSHSSKLAALGSEKDHALKNNAEKWLRKTPDVDIWPSHTCTYTYMYIFTHTEEKRG